MPHLIEIIEVEIPGLTRPKPYQAAYERFCEALQANDGDWDAAKAWLEYDSGLPDRGKAIVLKRAIERNLANIRVGKGGKYGH